VPPNSGIPDVLQFGSCELVSYEREIRVADLPARIGSRAFDILLTPAGAPGALVTKDEIPTRVCRCFMRMFETSLESSMKPRVLATKKRLPETRNSRWAHTQSRLVSPTASAESTWATTRSFTTALSYGACIEGRWKRFLCRVSPKDDPHGWSA
jgi:hypothetical protein